MSTTHNSVEIADSADKKPQMILDYNETKGAVDTLDKMISAYSCKRMTRRWPVAIFHNMVDISCYNFYVLYCEVYPEWKRKRTILRRSFLEKLAQQLVDPHIERRKTLPRTNAAIEVVHLVQSYASGRPLGEPAASTSQKKRGVKCARHQKMQKHQKYA